MCILKIPSYLLFGWCIQNEGLKQKVLLYTLTKPLTYTKLQWFFSSHFTLHKITIQFWGRTAYKDLTLKLNLIFIQLIVLIISLYLMRTISHIICFTLLIVFKCVFILHTEDDLIEDQNVCFIYMYLYIDIYVFLTRKSSLARKLLPIIFEYINIHKK